MLNIVENTVGRGTYETWPTGATRAIELIETQLRETTGFLTGQVTEVLTMLEKKYRPTEEVLNSNPEERKIWKEAGQLRNAIENRVYNLVTGFQKKE